MMNSSLRTLLSLGIAGIVALLLAGCDAATAQEQTHEYVLQGDMQRLGSRVDTAEELDALGEESAEILRRRLAGGGFDSQVSAIGDGRLLVRMGGENHRESLEAAAGIPGELSIRLVDETALPFDIEQGKAPPGSEILPMREYGISIAVRRLGGISGANIVRADQAFDEYTDEPVIMIAFDREGTAKFAKLTRESVGRRFAIILDDEVLSAPVVNEPILAGNAMISGGFTEEDAQALAIILSENALPAPFMIAEERELARD